MPVFSPIWEISFFLIYEVLHSAADPTLQTDTESLAQLYFALGGQGWQRRDGEILDLLWKIRV